MLIALLIAALRRPVVVVPEIPILTTLAFDVRLQRQLVVTSKVTRVLAMTNKLS